MLVNAIWDLDGTLFDTYPEMVTALHAVLTAQGVTISQAALLVAIKRESIQTTVTNYAQQLGVPIQGLLEAYHALERQTVMTARPYPEARMVLEAVKAAGGHNLLMTHRDRSAWALLQQAGLRDLFLDGVTSELALPRKPRPDAINYLLHQDQLNPARTAMIGDRKLDVIAGQAAGVTGVYFNVDGLNDAPMADVSIDHLRELVPLFSAR
ncbi:HAD hydrolase-like protein [Lacticaseibacillus absianus]|uniref:HAD hydrolase-like protein n=1 Tax=Lacticaseibacillus absianus TaxID=2729623 RepID=UPI0015C94A4B|nr:HAD hydrolase-like protein [Lacticaseibacillus absianus]